MKSLFELDRLVNTEHLKAEQPMEWVGRMNNIRHRVEEIIREELIDTL